MKHLLPLACLLLSSFTLQSSFDTHNTFTIKNTTDESTGCVLEKWGLVNNALTKLSSGAVILKPGEKTSFCISSAGPSQTSHIYLAVAKSPAGVRGLAAIGCHHLFALQVIPGTFAHEATITYAARQEQVGIRLKIS